MAVAAPLLVVTDLDGSLLDEETYSWDAAREALAALKEQRVPVVLCSSKTRAEMEVLERDLDLRAPFIAENGGALVVPDGHLPGPVPQSQREGDLWTLELGTRRNRLAQALADIARETGARIRGFASLGASELARLTGLSPRAAALSLDRHHDEPFLLEDAGALPSVAEAARRRGLRVTRGGRFHHLTGPTDKGKALHVLLGLYASVGRRFTTVGLGDSLNDLPMLQAANRPVVVPRPGGQVDPALRDALPDAERAPAPGPVGWNSAVLAVLRDERLPRVGDAPGDAERW
jgi:mannosyl-3-phosphoglycerate phosphatase